MPFHLDLVGGMAGDMFIAGLLDAFPDLENGVRRAIDAVNARSPVVCSIREHRDGVLRGLRFDVEAPLARRPPSILNPKPPGGDHRHVTWASIRRDLDDAALESGTRAHAIAIFELLAEAEARVHGTDPADVAFHEVGAWDSIADVVGAAALIERLGHEGWSCSPVPLGSGRVQTAHGLLPVPAPATALLLLGMATLDDGIAGERVTPTGAALLKYLCGPSRTRGAAGRDRVRRLSAVGTGFGGRSLPGLSNVVRVLCYDDLQKPWAQRRRIEVVEFEVDDQSAEDLGMGLDRLRGLDAVLEATQTAVIGKKGRMMVHVRLLVRPAQLSEVIEACFRETSTIGLRHGTVEGIALERRSAMAIVDGEPIRVKVVERPDGATAKAEADDVIGLPRAERLARRARAEKLVLSGPVTGASVDA